MFSNAFFRYIIMKTGKKGYKLLDNNAFFRYIIMKTRKKSFINISYL